MATSLTIWKYRVSPGINNIEIPEGARILDMQIQFGEPHIWALVDPVATKEIRQFTVHGTGHDLPRETATYDYIGTFQLQGGTLVFHVFETNGTE